MKKYFFVYGVCWLISLGIVTLAYPTLLPGQSIAVASFLSFIFFIGFIILED